MRLTTKIILGIILSVFIISLTFIIGFSFTDRKNQKQSNVIDLPQGNLIGIELASFKTILIDEIQLESNGYNYGLSDKCNIIFDSVPANPNPEMLFIPGVLKEFIAVYTSDDTLMIKLNVPDLGEKFRTDAYRFQVISGINLHFNISKFDIVNKAQLLSIVMKNIETDSMKVASNSNIFIDSCKVLCIEPQFLNNYRSLKISNCDVKRINLDLDNMWNCNIESCNIEEEYITGSRTHSITQNKNEASTINWNPKEKDAELNIKIQGEPAKIIIQ